MQRSSRSSLWGDALSALEFVLNLVILESWPVLRGAARARCSPRAPRRQAAWAALARWVWFA